MAHQPETNASFPDPKNPQDQQGTQSQSPRPADGARIVSPGHTTNAPTPQGSGDFLNLDRKGASDAAAPDGSWLMDGGAQSAPQGMPQPSMPSGSQTPVEPTSVDLDPRSPSHTSPAPAQPASASDQGTWLLNENSEDVEIPAITSELTGLLDEPVGETSWSDEDAGPSFASRWAPRFIAMAMAGAAGAMGIVYMDGMRKETTPDIEGPTVMAPTEALTRSTELVGVEAPTSARPDTPRIIRRAAPEATGTEREPGELSIWASSNPSDDGDEDNHMQGGPEADLAASTLAALDALMADPNAAIDGKVVLLEDESLVTAPEPVAVTVDAQPEGFWLASLAQPSLFETRTPFEMANEGMLVDLDRGPMASISDIGSITIETEVLAHSPANVPPMEFKPQLYMWPIGFLTNYEIQYGSTQDSSQGSTLALEPAEVTFTDDVILIPVESTEIAQDESASSDFDPSLAAAESEVAQVEIVMAPEDDASDLASMETPATDIESMEVSSTDIESTDVDVLADATDATDLTTDESETLASVDPTQVDPGQVEVDTIATTESELADATDEPAMAGPGNAEVAPFGEMPDYFDAETPNLDLESEFFEFEEATDVADIVTSETPATESTQVEPFESSTSDPALAAAEPESLTSEIEATEFEVTAAENPTSSETGTPDFETGEFESDALEFSEVQVQEDESGEPDTEDAPQVDPWQAFLQPDGDEFPFQSVPSDLETSVSETSDTEFDLAVESTEMGEAPSFDEPTTLDPEFGPTASSDEHPLPGMFDDTDLLESTDDEIVAAEVNPLDDEVTSTTEPSAVATGASPQVTGMLERLADPARSSIEDVATAATETTPATTEVTVPEFDVTSTGALDTETALGTDGDDLLQAFADFTDGATELTPVHDWPEPTTEGTSGSANASTDDDEPTKQVGILNRIESGRQWTRRNPPEHLMNGEKRMTTPNVGAVRVTLTEGDVFEGKLVAVGKGLVELETTIGSLTLGSARVAKIARLDPSQLNDKGTASRDGDQGGQTRVRVEAPGGVFTGRQIARDGNEITLVTDQGLRITLVSDKIEEFGAQKRVGLRRRGEETTVKGVKVEDVEPETDLSEQDGVVPPTETPKSSGTDADTSSEQESSTPEVAPGQQPPAGWEN
tara:strand:- start:6770 stop:10189 length:3420 start_codon:yes stop_codon:yes gene_type:complete